MSDSTDTSPNATPKVAVELVDQNPSRYEFVTEINKTNALGTTSNEHQTPSDGSVPPTIPPTKTRTSEVQDAAGMHTTNNNTTSQPLAPVPNSNHATDCDMTEPSQKDYSKYHGTYQRQIRSTTNSQQQQQQQQNIGQTSTSQHGQQSQQNSQQPPDPALRTQSYLRLANPTDNRSPHTRQQQHLQNQQTLQKFPFYRPNYSKGSQFSSKYPATNEKRFNPYNKSHNFKSNNDKYNYVKNYQTNYPALAATPTSPPNNEPPQLHNTTPWNNQGLVSKHTVANQQPNKQSNQTIHGHEDVDLELIEENSDDFTDLEEYNNGNRNGSNGSYNSNVLTSDVYRPTVQPQTGASRKDHEPYNRNNNDFRQNAASNDHHYTYGRSNQGSTSSTNRVSQNTAGPSNTGRATGPNFLHANNNGRGTNTHGNRVALLPPPPSADANNDVGSLQQQLNELREQLKQLEDRTEREAIQNRSNNLIIENLEFQNGADGKETKELLTSEVLNILNIIGSNCQLPTLTSDDFSDLHRIFKRSSGKPFTVPTVVVALIQKSNTTKLKDNAYKLGNFNTDRKNRNLKPIIVTSHTTARR